MINYDESVFALVKPPGKIINVKRLVNEAAHSELLHEALSKELLLYYTIVDGETVKQPWILDWASVPNSQSKKPKLDVQPKAPVKRPPPQLSPVPPRVIKDGPLPVLEIPEPDIISNMPSYDCPYCEKTLSSTSGRTLHVKNKHPDEYENYRDALARTS